MPKCLTEKKQKNMNSENSFIVKIIKLNYFRCLLIKLFNIDSDSV